jgi:hypothetical protein
MPPQSHVIFAEERPDHQVRYVSRSINLLSGSIHPSAITIDPGLTLWCRFNVRTPVFYEIQLSMRIGNEGLRGLIGTRCKTRKKRKRLRVCSMNSILGLSFETELVVTHVEYGVTYNIQFHFCCFLKLELGR